MYRVREGMATGANTVAPMPEPPTNARTGASIELAASPDAEKTRRAEQRRRGAGGETLKSLATEAEREAPAGFIGRVAPPALARPSRGTWRRDRLAFEEIIHRFALPDRPV